MKTIPLKEQKGFTLVELMVALVVFGLAMAAATSSFLPLVGHFTQESKIAETQMESVISIDVLRYDIEHAGFGLPLSVMNVTDTAPKDGELFDEVVGYDEAEDSDYAQKYDDEGRAPRAIVMDDNVGDSAVPRSGINDSDYLVVRSALVRNFPDAGKWTYMTWDKDTGVSMLHKWVEKNNEERNISPEALVIVMKTMRKDESNRKTYKPLVASTGAVKEYALRFGGEEGLAPDFPANLTVDSPFGPADPSDTYLVYAVGDAEDMGLRMPFNRADYYISTKGVPSRCAPQTGVLMKAVMQHRRDNDLDGKFSTYIPLFDCVADMQIIVGLDMDGDGTIGTYWDGLLYSATEETAEVTIKETMNNAKSLWARLKEVRVYILAHEGQRDPGFSYGQSKVDVGEFTLGKSGSDAKRFDLAGIVGDPEYKYYRWKVYTMVIKPGNLGLDVEPEN